MDAFTQMEVDPTERKYLGGQRLGGFFVYCVLLFGVKSGPLVWGRVAALLMRVSATALFQEPARLFCFMDDPLMATIGPEKQRRRIASGVLVLWAA